MATRVLVVDDSHTIRRVVMATLTRAGYEVGQAADGAFALTLLERESFDLALVDFVMPRVNGFELCRKIRERPEIKDLPIVLMSAKADKIREHFLRQTGALDAITKPFDPRALLLTVESTLQRAKGKTTRTSSEPPSGRDTLREDSTSGTNPAVAAAPEAFVQRLAESIQKFAPKLQGLQGQLAETLRREVGDQVLGVLYVEMVGTLARAVLSGDLGAIPLAEVLQLLQLQRQSGVLSIFDEHTEIQVAMREGRVDLAVARGAAGEFRLGRYVVELGKLDRESLDVFLERERSSNRNRLLGDALVADAILTREELQIALERQTSELIYEVLRWTHGRFVFDQKNSLPPSHSARLGLPIASIVMEGFRRVDEWRLMEGSLGDFDQVFYRDTGVIDGLGLNRLAPAEQRVLEAVDGERNVRELIDGLQMGSFEVCKVLYQLSQSRLVRRKLG